MTFPAVGKYQCDLVVPGHAAGVSEQLQIGLEGSK